jgi:hypothetical protein
MKTSLQHLAESIGQALGHSLSPEPVSGAVGGRPVLGAALGNAKQAAFESPVWNDEREEHELYVEEILEAWGLDAPR